MQLCLEGASLKWGLNWNEVAGMSRNQWLCRKHPSRQRVLECCRVRAEALAKTQREVQRPQANGLTPYPELSFQTLVAWWAAVLLVQFLTFLAYLCLLINLYFYSASFKGQTLQKSEVGKSRAWNDTTSAASAKRPSLFVLPIAHLHRELSFWALRTLLDKNR